MVLSDQEKDKLRRSYDDATDMSDFKQPKNKSELIFLVDYILDKLTSDEAKAQ